jgi:hypothetical protein
MAGMVTGSQLTEELARKRESDRRRIAALDSSVTGRYAKTVGSCVVMSCPLGRCGCCGCCCMDHSLQMVHV